MQLHLQLRPSADGSHACESELSVLSLQAQATPLFAPLCTGASELLRPPGAPRPHIRARSFAPSCPARLPMSAAPSMQL
eukprot:scaffold27439_cov34-Tisochrysis_lutea.AAC.3